MVSGVLVDKVMAPRVLGQLFFQIGTGPFGLAYEHMFNPMIGKIVMGLAVLACLGSLLGWQFTIAQTGKAANRLSEVICGSPSRRCQC